MPPPGPSSAIGVSSAWTTREPRANARYWQRVVKDLRCCGFLHEQLAAPAIPLASDLPLYEELRRNDVQPLVDVLTHAHHRLAALWHRAVCVFGLHALVHAWQVGRQGLALGLAAWLLVWCGAVFVSTAAGCNAASWASRLAWSAAHVSSNSARCSAFMASILSATPSQMAWALAAVVVVRLYLRFEGTGRISSTVCPKPYSLHAQRRALQQAFMPTGYGGRLTTNAAVWPRWSCCFRTVLRRSSTALI